MAKSVSAILVLADKSANPQSPTTLKQDMTDAVGSLVLLQTFARVASQQPVINPALAGPDVDLLSSLQQHQTAARRNADYLNATVSPRIVGTITDILAYSHTMDAFSTALMPLLPQIVENPAARSQALAVLAQLDMEAGIRQANASSVATLLSVAQAKVQQDSENLAADVAEADKAIESDTGRLAEIQNQISDIHKKIGAEIAGVVVSSLVLVAGGVIIAVGALATLPANVTATSVILAGVGVVITGATGLTAAAAALGADNARLAELYQQSAALNTTVTLVKAVASQVQSLSDVTTGLAGAISTLNTQWSEVRSGIAQLRDEITKASDASDVAHAIAAVHLAQLEWQSVAAQSQSMLSRLVELTPQDVQDILKPTVSAVAA